MMSTTVPELVTIARKVIQPISAYSPTVEVTKKKKKMSTSRHSSSHVRVCDVTNKTVHYVHATDTEQVWP